MCIYTFYLHMHVSLFTCNYINTLFFPSFLFTSTPTGNQSFSSTRLLLCSCIPVHYKSCILLIWSFMCACVHVAQPLEYHHTCVKCNVYSIHLPLTAWLINYISLTFMTCVYHFVVVYCKYNAWWCFVRTIFLIYHMHCIVKSYTLGPMPPHIHTHTPCI